MANRSQFEEFLEQQIKFRYPVATYQFNNRNIITDASTGKGLELDLYMQIEDLRVGLEIDGPTHYLPIFGADTLTRTRRLDEAKNEACKSNGIYLIRINISTMHNFNVTDAMALCRNAFGLIDSLLKEYGICAKPKKLRPLAQRQLPEEAPF